MHASVSGICMCVQMGVCTGACRSRPEIYALFLCCSVPELGAQWISQTARPAAPGSSCLCLPSSGVQAHARLSLWGLGVWTQVLRQALYWLSYFSSSSIFFFYSLTIHIIESFHDHAPASNLREKYKRLSIYLGRRSNSLLKIKRNYKENHIKPNASTQISLKPLNALLSKQREVTAQLETLRSQRTWVMRRLHARDSGLDSAELRVPTRPCWPLKMIPPLGSGG